MPLCFRMPPSRLAPHLSPIALFFPATGKSNDLWALFLWDFTVAGAAKENEIPATETQSNSIDSFFISKGLFHSTPDLLIYFAPFAKEILIPLTLNKMQ